MESQAKTQAKVFLLNWVPVDVALVVYDAVEQLLGSSVGLRPDPGRVATTRPTDQLLLPVGNAVEHPPTMKHFDVSYTVSRVFSSPTG